MKIHELTPDDQLELDDFAKRLLVLYLESEIEKSKFTTVLVHMLASHLNNRDSVTEYAIILLELWNQYHDDHGEIDE